MPTNPSPTRFSDTAGEANSVIDLMFLQYRSSELNQHSIHPDSCLSSDHAPLTSPFQLLMCLSIPPNYQYLQTVNKNPLLLKISFQFSKTLKQPILLTKIIWKALSIMSRPLSIKYGPRTQNAQDSQNTPSNGGWKSAANPSTIIGQQEVRKIERHSKELLRIPNTLSST